MNNDLFRQRRNLMGTSILIVLLLTLGFSVETLSPLGITVKIDNTYLIPIFLWILHLYFLYRFWTFVYDEGHNKGYRNTLKIQVIDDLYKKAKSVSGGRIKDENEDVVKNSIEKYLNDDYSVYINNYDFTSFMDKPQNDSYNEERNLKVTDEDLKKYKRNSFLDNYILGSFFSSYLLPSMLGFTTLLLLGASIINSKPKEKLMVSFKDYNTSMQIQNYCADRLNEKSLEYKICVKELEKKLY